MDQPGIQASPPSPLRKNARTCGAQCWVPGFVLMTLASLAFLGVLGVLLFVMPEFLQIYASMGARLPVLAAVVFKAANAVGALGILLLPVVVALVAAMVALPLVRPSPVWTVTGAVLSAVFLLAIAVQVIAIFSPIDSLLNTMQAK